MKKLLLFVLAATALAACSTDTTQDLAPEIPTAPDELQVSFDEEDTRIQLGENGAPVWTEGDLVSVFYKSDGNDCYKFTGKTGDREGTLKRTSVGEWSRRGDNVVVVYPYSKSYIISLSANTVEASLPDEQTYAKNSYGIGSSLMIATGDYKQFALKNVCGWLKLQFTGTGYVSKIVLRGNNGEQVAGNMLVCADDASCILAEASADIDDDEVGGALITDGDILTSVTLNCGDGVALNSKTPTAFYVALPPQTFEKGFTATMYGCDGSTKEISTKNLITIERNHIQPMASATLEMPIPSNQIWYTSSNGKIVKPYKTDVFGANITSNTYENGVGVITFDGDVTKIGVDAFRDCTALTSITIPDSVTTIGKYAFSDCYVLTSVTIPDSVTKIEYCAFGGCYALTSVTIPDSVTTIGEGAFASCYALTSVTIPDSVTTIGEGAFIWCSALTSVTIPDSVTTFGENAFRNCSALKEVYCKPTTPPSLDGSSVFDNNSSDRKIYVPTASVDAYKAADGWKEYADAIVAMPIQSNEIWYTSSDGNVVEPYSGHLNSNATAMQTFGANITSNTYENGVGVITFDGDVTKIEYCAFYDCNALTSVTIGNSVTTIGEHAFYWCSSLTSVTIPDSMTTIGREAFASCDALTSVTIPDSVTTIGSSAFLGCDALKAFYGKFASADNRCLIVDGVLNSFAPAGLTTYSIPDSVTTIGVNAFGDCSALTSVTIGNSVTTIGNYAFYWCSALTSVTIPNSVTTIGDSAFYNCYALTSVTIPDSVTTIGSGAFASCTALKAFYGKFASADNRCLIVNGVLNSFAPAGLTTYSIPDSVTTIGWCTFVWCDALTSVTIPDSVTTIGDYAFAYCYALTSVTIPNSVTSIGDGAFRYCYALKTVYCKPTTPPSLDGSYVFRNNASDRKIYVPTASVDAYKAADGWSEYADAIEPYNFTE